MPQPEAPARHLDGAAKVRIFSGFSKVESEVNEYELYSDIIPLLALMHRLILGLTLLLSGCASSRELFGRYYWIGGGFTGVSRPQLEQQVSSMYADGTFTANGKLWLPLLNQHAAYQSEKVVSLGLNLKEGYSLDARGRKSFLLYHGKTRTFYGFKFWNFRGLRKEHTPCDLLVESITVLQPDSTLKHLKWTEAGPALATFKHELLPVIRNRVRQ